MTLQSCWNQECNVGNTVHNGTIRICPCTCVRRCAHKSLRCARELSLSLSLSHTDRKHANKHARVRMHQSRPRCLNVKSDGAGHNNNGEGCNDIAGDNRNSHAQNQNTGWCMRSAVQCDVRCRGVPPPMPYTSVDTGSARLSRTRSQRFRIMPLEHAHVRMRAPACHAIAVPHPEETTPTAQCKAKVWGRHAKQNRLVHWARKQGLLCPSLSP